MERKSVPSYTNADHYSFTEALAIIRSLILNEELMALWVKKTPTMERILKVTINKDITPLEKLLRIKNILAAEKVQKVAKKLEARGIEAKDDLTKTKALINKSVFGFFDLFVNQRPVLYHVLTTMLNFLNDKVKFIPDHPPIFIGKNPDEFMSHISKCISLFGSLFKDMQDLTARIFEDKDKNRKLLEEFQGDAQLIRLTKETSKSLPFA